MLGSTGHTTELTHSARTESVQLYGAPGYHFTYARNDLGEIMALGDEPGLPGGDWANLGKPGGVTARSQGVAATFESSNGNVHVFAVGQDGNLYEGITDSSYQVSWTQFAAPSGKVLTGHLAAAAYEDPLISGRYVAVVATTTDGLLYRWRRPIGGGSAAWSNVSGGYAWETTTPLAATTNPIETVVSFFGTIDAGFLAKSLGMHRISLTSTTTNQGNPGFSVCSSISAAQGQITASMYRLYVVCTNALGATSTIAFAYGTSETDSTLTWLTQSLPSSLPVTRGNIAASVYRADGSNGAIDMYYLTGDNHLRRTTRTSTGLASTVDLGLVAEAKIPFGGMTAATAYDTQDYSRVLFIGQIDDAYGDDAHYLYERSGRYVPIWEWEFEFQNYGAGDPHKVLASGKKYAEGMIAEYGGTAALAVMERPGTGPQDWPLVSVTRSYDDYDTLDPITVLPTTLGGISYNFADPTVGVTDQGRTYVSELAEDKATCSGTVYRGAAYLLTAAKGSSSWTPILIRNDLGNGDGKVPLDHPAMDIEHVSGGPDRVHMAWWMTEHAGINDRTIEYAVLTEGSTPQPTRYVIADGQKMPDPDPAYAPRISVSDDGAVYVYTNIGAEIFVCRVIPDPLSGYRCSPGWSKAASDFDPGNIPIPGIAREIRNPVAYSLAISPGNSDRVYLCYQRRETAGTKTEKDIACKYGFITGSTFGWGTALPVGPQNDARDQFAPEVSTTGRTFSWEASVSSFGEVYVHFYDRYADPNNRTYRVRASKTINAGASWYAPIVVDGSDYDPADLPIHCSAQTAFIGEYAISRGSSHHTHGLYVAPSSASTAIKTSFRSLGNWWE